MQVGVLVERRYLRQEMPGALVRQLERWGVDVEIICTQACRFDPQYGVLRGDNGRQFDLRRYDVVVTRNRTGVGLAVLSFAEAAGILAINAYGATQAVRNKASMAVVLGQAGVPCAPTILADHASVLAGLPADWFPLILKATYGDNSQGLRLIRRPADLFDIHWADTPVLAQHYLPNDGFDLKLYVCGRRVFAMRKPSLFNGDPSVPPQLIRPDARMVELALRCGATFGLEVYGVDTIETAAGPVVIEVNEFPNFTAVPGAAEHIAAYVLARVKEAGQGNRIDQPSQEGRIGRPGQWRQIGETGWITDAHCIPAAAAVA